MTSGEFTITFYSTDDKANSKSKYPKQSKTSYTVPDDRDTDINFGKTLQPALQAKKVSTMKNKYVTQHTQNNKKVIQQDEAQKQDSTIVRSRSGRLICSPIRYEPTEITTDDFNCHEYDSDDSSDF